MTTPLQFKMPNWSSIKKDFLEIKPFVAVDPFSAFAAGHATHAIGAPIAAKAFVGFKASALAAKYQVFKHHLAYMIYHKIGAKVLTGPPGQWVLDKSYKSPIVQSKIKPYMDKLIVSVGRTHHLQQTVLDFKGRNAFSIFQETLKVATFDKSFFQKLYQLEVEFPQLLAHLKQAPDVWHKTFKAEKVPNDIILTLDKAQAHYPDYLKSIIKQHDISPTILKDLANTTHDQGWAKSLKESFEGYEKISTLTELKAFFIQLQDAIKIADGSGFTLYQIWLADLTGSIPW